MAGTTRTQRVVVLRHGDRLDQKDSKWAAGESRPWDPPLTEEGVARAWKVGKELCPAALGFPITRVFVSPFLRCLQTAKQAVIAICGDEHAVAAQKSPPDAGFAIDPSRVKVSLEYGLCEMLNFLAMGRLVTDNVPADKKNWFPDIDSEIQSIFPAGTLDISVEPIYKEMLDWGETVLDTRKRFVKIIQALANKYPEDDLLLVTHGEGVGTSVAYFQQTVEVEDVDYCAYSLIEREITIKSGEEPKGEKFRVLTKNEVTGVKFRLKEDRYRASRS